ncbi:hypothetical protein MPSEU_000513400 [Mayamaea pseudoterrestris]|nr:hypothetical protein MPSEU_000513400 [Mayamaea pseudoterrestris]
MSTVSDTLSGSTSDSSQSFQLGGKDYRASVSKGETKALYQYTDYGCVDDDAPLLELPAVAATSNTQLPNSDVSIRAQKFPVKLYAILSQKEFHHIISFQPHGRSWKVLKPDMFENIVMPLYFEYNNYHSFNRLVNAWSFRRISSGPDRGSYYNELFLRGKPHLQMYMRRLPKTHKKIPTKKSHEPDFYALDKKCPLPPLEEHIDNHSTYEESPASSPFLQHSMVTPPLPNLCSMLQSSTQNFSSDLLALFDESIMNGESMYSFHQQMPLNTHQRHHGSDQVPLYAGRGIVPLSPTPIATESFLRLQQQQQHEEQFLQQQDHRYLQQQLLQMRSNPMFDCGGAFDSESQDLSFAYASPQQQNLY